MITQQIENGCKDCQERHPGCHSECEKYKAFKEHLEEEKKKRQADRDFDQYMAHNLARHRAAKRRGSERYGR